MDSVNSFNEAVKESFRSIQDYCGRLELAPVLREYVALASVSPAPRVGAGTPPFSWPAVTAAGWRQMVVAADCEIEPDMSYASGIVAWSAAGPHDCSCGRRPIPHRSLGLVDRDLSGKPHTQMAHGQPVDNLVKIRECRKSACRADKWMIWS